MDLKAVTTLPTPPKGYIEEKRERNKIRVVFRTGKSQDFNAATIENNGPIIYLKGPSEFQMGDGEIVAVIPSDVVSLIEPLKVPTEKDIRRIMGAE